eukprot:6083283-Pleurochrysis_carterae.AAC.2
MTAMHHSSGNTQTRGHRESWIPSALTPYMDAIHPADERRIRDSNPHTAVTRVRVRSHRSIR